MSRHIEKLECDVELWRIKSPSGDPEDDAFVVKDPSRTPEEWRFFNSKQAIAKFEELVNRAQHAT